MLVLGLGLGLKGLAMGQNFKANILADYKIHH